MFLDLSAIGIGNARVTRERKLVALLIAGCADLLQGVLFPLFIEGVFSPLESAVDLLTALGLVLVIGWRPRIALAFLAELVPGLDLFPTWTALVLTLPVAETSPPAGRTPARGGPRIIDVEPVRDDRG